MKNSKQSVKNGEAKCALGSTPSSLLFTFVSDPESESFCWALSARSTAVCLFLCWYLLLIASYFIGRSTGHGYLANTSFASRPIEKAAKTSNTTFVFKDRSLSLSVRSLEPGLRARCPEKKKHTVQYWLLFIHAISLIHKRMVAALIFLLCIHRTYRSHWRCHPIPINTSHVICSSWK